MTLFEELEKVTKEYRKNVPNSPIDESEFVRQGMYFGLLKAMDIVKKHSSWIPSSKPPKDKENVLIYLEDETGWLERTGWYESFYGMWFLDNVEGHILEDLVKAWQPLPEKYKGIISVGNDLKDIK